VPQKRRSVLISQGFHLTSQTGSTTLSRKLAQYGGISVEHQPPSDVSLLLQAWRDGDRKALDALLPLVYKELRRVAHFQLRNEPPNHSLQSAGLVNEAYLRLVGMSHPQCENRTHFFAIAAQLMRQILVDYARRNGAVKRGGSVCKVSLDGAMLMARRKAVDVVALDDALKDLTKLDPRQGRVVELRFFTGLSLLEISEVMEIAPATVQRDWTAARAWLYREISRNSGP
jgi:RNA polymerase sigma factor (TIGR02999 family)